MKQSVSKNIDPSSLLVISPIEKLLLITLLFFCHVVHGQNETVVFNYERSYFNDDQPLPAAKNFTITGPVSDQVSMVEVLVYHDKPELNGVPLYQSLWKRNATEEAQYFFLPVNLHLRSTEYDLVINYYRRMNDNEIENIKNDLYGALDAYIEQSLSNKPNLRLFKKTQESIDDLNSIVHSATVYYKNNKNIKFEGFSDIIREKIKAIKSIKNKTVKVLYPDMNQDQALLQYQKTQVDGLKEMVHNETAYLLNMTLSVLADSKHVDNYPVENTPNIMTIHGGYGGVYLDGDIDNLSYGSGFRAGMTFHLGKKAYARKFWSNSAVVAGFFLNNFTKGDGVIVSGPIFKRPTYIGLGYKAFNFVRVSAGASFLENQETAGGLSNLGNKVSIRPFIGLQADLDFWLDLAK